MKTRERCHRWGVVLRESFDIELRVQRDIYAAVAGHGAG